MADQSGHCCAGCGHVATVVAPRQRKQEMSQTPIYNALMREKQEETDFHCCLDHECGFVAPPDRRHCGCLRIAGSGFNFADPRKTCRRGQATCSKMNCRCWGVVA